MTPSCSPLNSPNGKGCYYLESVNSTVEFSLIFTGSQSVDTRGLYGEFFTMSSYGPTV